MTITRLLPKSSWKERQFKLKQDKILAYKLRVDEETGEPYKGYFEEIDNTLEAKQKYVNGHIEVIRLTNEIDVVLNEESKIRGMNVNRAWIEDGKVIDLLPGNLLCIRHDEEGNFTPILREDESTILKYLKPVTMLGKVCVVMPESFFTEFKK